MRLAQGCASVFSFLHHIVNLFALTASRTTTKPTVHTSILHSSSFSIVLGCLRQLSALRPSQQISPSYLLLSICWSRTSSTLGRHICVFSAFLNFPNFTLCRPLLRSCYMMMTCMLHKCTHQPIRTLRLHYHMPTHTYVYTCMQHDIHFYLIRWLDEPTTCILQMPAPHRARCAC